jgi:hypothetical protein
VALLACAVVLGDLLGTYGWWYEWRAPAYSRTEVDAMLQPGSAGAVGPVPDAPGGLDRALFVGADVRWALPDLPPLAEARGQLWVNGYDPLAPHAYLEAAGAMAYNGATGDPAALLRPSSALLDLLRVTRVVIHPEGSTGEEAADGVVDGAADVPGRALRTFTRSPALPDAFLVGATRTASRAAVLADVQGRGDPFSPADVALLEEGCDRCPGAAAPGPAGTVEGVVRWGQSSVHLSVEAQRSAVVVLSQAWFPGWSARVDGHDAPVVRVDGVVQGVPVGPGAHDVVLRYRPPGLVAGVAVSVLTWVVLLGGWALAVVRRRRPLPRSGAVVEGTRAP